MRQHRLELRPQRHHHHARINSHYHIMTHRIQDKVLIDRRVLRST